MSSIRFLRTFIAIAEHGSFAAAAEHVALTQAAVGMQMRVLEAEIRQTLFDRSGRHAALNGNGLALLPQIRKIVAWYDALSETADPGESLVGSVTLGAVMSVMGAMAAVVARLKHRHPRLDIRLLSGKSFELNARLDTREIDAAVLVRMQGRTPRSLQWMPLYDEPMVLLAHHSTGNTDARTLLAEQPFLSFDHTQRTGALIDHALRRQGIDVDEFLQMNSLETIAELVRQNVGVSIVPLLRNSSWKHDPLLRVMPLPKAVAPRPIGMLARADAIRPEVTRLLLENLDGLAQGRAAGGA
jgi:DNA-binding transcriptional LysR family regulator